MKNPLNSLLLIAMLLFAGTAQAQQVTGRVVDTQGIPVEAATVVMQTPDSVFVDACLTDSTGAFRLKDGPERYRLLIQHLMYQPRQLTAQGADAGSITLESASYELGEVTVKADRPIVRVEEGRLAYDVPQLVKDKTVTNAYEALQELPGVLMTDGALTLAGAGTPGILINGQLTTLSYDQVVNLLKSTPAARVKKAEVMYSAPPQYNVRGALINVVLEENTTQGKVLQGEVMTEYRQRAYGAGKVQGNVVYSTPNFALDVLYSLRSGKSHDEETMVAHHTLQDQVYQVDQYNESNGRSTGHVVRVGSTFIGPQKDRLSVVYTGNFDSGTTTRTSDTRISGRSPIYTNNQVDGPSSLHNAKMEFNGHGDLVAGADYTYYDDTSNQQLTNTASSGTASHLLSVSRQQIQRGMLFANQTHALPRDWKLNYGGNLTFSYIKNYSDTYLDEVVDPASSFSNTQREVTGNVFAGFTKAFTEKFSVQASLTAEYYKCTEEAGGTKTELWDDVALFPNVNATYTFSPQHILQFSLSSDKAYPGYWAINPTVYYLGAYSEVRGNPALKPSRDYSSQLTYIWRQKYVLTAYYSRTADRFTQLLYQSATELRTVFQTVNFDFREQAGMAVVIPFKVKEVLNSRLTVNGLRLREKMSNFHDLPFDRTKYFGVVQLNNTLNLSDRPNVKLDFNGSYVTPAQQGIYDLSSFYEVSAGAKWTFARDKAQLTLRCNDIFRSGVPDTEVNYRGQHSRMQLMQDTRTVLLSFTYKFGGFKKAKEVDVDRSRFGR